MPFLPVREKKNKFKSLKGILNKRSQSNDVRTERGNAGRKNRVFNNSYCISVYIIYKCAKTACFPSFPEKNILINLHKAANICRLSGSLTIEAALCIPVMTAFIYLMLFPMKIMEEERRIQNNMEQTAKYLILADYADDTAADLLDTESDYTKLIEDTFEDISGVIGVTAIAADAVDTGYFIYFLPDAENSILSSDEEDDPSMIYMKFNYALNMPFSIFNLSPIQKSLVTNRRAWSGSDGGRGRAEYGGERGGNDTESSSDNDDDTVVYVGKTSSTVYHLSLECHYLSNTTLTADASEMSSIKNSSGASYHACSSCNPGSTGTVYYFESGTAYHSSPDCSAISSYARSILLSEAAGMHVCSYCAAHYM